MPPWRRTASSGISPCGCGKLVKALPQRDARILAMRYGLDGEKEQTQQEVARRLGISRSYVSRIESVRCRHSGYNGSSREQGFRDLADDRPQAGMPDRKMRKTHKKTLSLRQKYSRCHASQKYVGMI